MTSSYRKFNDLLLKERYKQRVKQQIDANPHLAQTIIVSFNQKNFVKFRDEKSFFSSLLDIVRCEWFR